MVCVLEGKALRIVTVADGVRIPEPEEQWTTDFWGVRVALAGFVAEYLSSDETEPLTLDRLATGPGTPGTEHDFKHACRLALQASAHSPTQDSVGACLLEQPGTVQRMLSENWRAVEMVPAELMATGELCGERVVELVYQPPAG